jgi:RNA polymerase sigma factor (sigma-70 family)
LLFFKIVVYLSEMSTSTVNDDMKRDQDELKKQLKDLYKKWPELKRFLSGLGCNSSNAEDIFQEALVIYVRKKEDPSFVLTVAPFFYVRNTCKLLWYNQSRRNGKQATFELEQDVVALDDDWFQKEMKLSIIEKAIQQLGEQCRQILQLFYGAGTAMTEIAKKVGLRNEKVAKAQKYRCLQKAKENAQALEVQTVETSMS